MLAIGISLFFIVAMGYTIARWSDPFEVAVDYLGRNLKDGVKGATLNAVGSSLPELLTTVFFLWGATRETVAYNLVGSISGDAGSSIFNSIIIPVMIILVLIRMGTVGHISKKVILRDGLFLIGAEVLLILLFSGEYLYWWTAAIMTGYYFIYLFYMLKPYFGHMTVSTTNETIPEEEYEEYDTFEKYIFKNTFNRTGRAWGLLTGAAIGIAISCWVLVEAALALAVSLEINVLFVAFVLIAAASSVPDTIISMKEAKKGNHDDALSNVLGSNIFDITFSLAFPLLIYILIEGPIYWAQEGPNLIHVRIMLLLATIITIAIYYFSKELGKKQMYMLGITYMGFLSYVGWLMYSI